MRLRHRIKLQKNTPTIDASGQPIESWSTYKTVWANVEDKKGDEDDKHHPIEGQVECVATINYPHTGRIPQSSDRFLHGEGSVLRTVNIGSVMRLDGKRRMLLLSGTEVQDG